MLHRRRSSPAAVLARMQAPVLEIVPVQVESQAAVLDTQVGQVSSALAVTVFFLVFAHLTHFLVVALQAVFAVSGSQVASAQSVIATSTHLLFRLGGVISWCVGLHSVHLAELASHDIVLAVIVQLPFKQPEMRAEMSTHTSSLEPLAPLATF